MPFLRGNSLPLRASSQLHRQVGQSGDRSPMTLVPTTRLGATRFNLDAKKNAASPDRTREAASRFRTGLRDLLGLDITTLRRIDSQPTENDDSPEMFSTTSTYSESSEMASFQQGKRFVFSKYFFIETVLLPLGFVLCERECLGTQGLHNG